MVKFVLTFAAYFVVCVRKKILCCCSCLSSWCAAAVVRSCCGLSMCNSWGAATGCRCVVVGRSCCCKELLRGAAASVFSSWLQIYYECNLNVNDTINILAFLIIKSMSASETAQTSVNSIIILSTKHNGRLIKVWAESDLWLDSNSKPISK